MVLIEKCPLETVHILLRNVSVTRIFLTKIVRLRERYLFKEVSVKEIFSTYNAFWYYLNIN